MHWLVEVSRVGDTAPSERYCIDARRWQSALQEARRLRGDTGPLPKLTIELLDEGYRAVDPALKVRYLVTEAPPGTPLTAGAQAMHTARPPAVQSAAPTIVPTPLPSAPVGPSPVGSEQPAARISSVPPLFQVIRQRDERPTEANPIAYRELALAVKPGATREEIEALLLARLEDAKTTLPAQGRFVQIAVFDHMFVKRPVRPPLATLVWKDWRGEPVLAFPAFGDTAEQAAAASNRPPSWLSSLAPRPITIPPLGKLPDNIDVLSSAPPAPPAVRGSISHGPSATPPAPVTSSSTLVSGGSVAPRASALPTAAPRPPVSTAPAGRPSGLPEHGSVAPIPIVAVSGSQAGGAETKRPSVIPARVVSVGPSTSPPAATRAPPVESDEPVVPLTHRISSPASRVAEATRATEQPASMIPDSAPAIEVGEAAPLSENSAAFDVELAPTSFRTPPPDIWAKHDEEVGQGSEPARAAPTAPAPEPVRRSEPVPARRSEPPPGARPARRSDPVPARRRGPGEDLIGELFERMHDLAFMVDLVSGADFVVQLLAELIPCEAIVVHAFDLNRREFVVVRARGPKARDALLHRTSDADPLVREVMRRRSVLSNGASPIRSAAFDKLGVETKTILSAPARQGGRYLGMIELANPLGGAPFHEGEAHALEYVCEQFAEFVASRPVVLDADVVLGS